MARFAAATSPLYRLGPFNDALRYTLVLPELTYWRGVGGVLEALGALGLAAKSSPRRWRRSGYKGVNLTVIASSGYEFELQVHTSLSLAAAELTHPSYEEQRRLPRTDPRWREIEVRAAEVWKSVPNPPGEPKL